MRETTGGVDFEVQLRAVSLADTRADEDACGDRVTLPVSALHALQFKNALDVPGALTFALSTPEGRCTHSCVLEFVALEDTIGLPRKVAASLAAELDRGDGVSGTMITAKFVRLPKATRVALQPHSAAFAAAVADVKGASVPVYDSSSGKWVLPGLEGVLHKALQPLSCLTEGDLISVALAQHSYEVSVLAVEPANTRKGVSLLDADVEIDLVSSTSEQAALDRDRAAAVQAATAASEAAHAAAEQRAAAEEALGARRAAARARLAEEAAEGEDGAVLVALRLTSGERRLRRLLGASRLQQVPQPETLSPKH